jgi:hypothetical protein
LCPADFHLPDRKTVSIPCPAICGGQRHGQTFSIPA